MHQLCKLENFVVDNQALSIHGQGNSFGAESSSASKSGDAFVDGSGVRTALHGPLPYVVKYAGHIMEEMLAIPARDISMMISGHENGVNFGKQVALNFSFAPSSLTSSAEAAAAAAPLPTPLPRSLPTVVRMHGRAMHAIIVGPAPAFDHILHVHPQDRADDAMNRGAHAPLRALHLSSRGDTGRHYE